MIRHVGRVSFCDRCMRLSLPAGGSGVCASGCGSEVGIGAVLLGARVGGTCRG